MATEGKSMHTFIRSLLPRRFERVLSRAESATPLDLSDISVEEVAPGHTLNIEQKAFLLKHMRGISLWRLLQWHRRGVGWVFLAKCEGRYAFYVLVTPANRYRRIFPVMTEPKALLLGPGLTETDFRGRSIHPRMLQHVVCALSERGWGPFYGSTSSTNAAALRGIAKAGFQRCGVWAGVRALFNLIVITRRVSD